MQTVSRSTLKRVAQKSARAKAATLADVARIAGVVPMTASRAINNSGYVGEEVRRKVTAVARQLHYRPNILARTLRGDMLHVVGIMLPDVSNPFSAELVEGMKAVLVPAGYAAFLATAHRSTEQEKAGLLAFADHRVDGILVATRGTQIGNDTIAEIARRGVPLVTVGRPIERCKVDCVTADHRRGAMEAINHLVELGHRRIAFLGISPEDSGRLRRFEGYAEALAAAGIALRLEYIVGPKSGPDYATQEDGYEGMKRLATLKRPPTAVFARNDYTAIGALHAACDLGISVPGDLALAGFDNIPLAAYSNPPLTTVEQPIVEQGRYAAQFLLDRIDGKAAKRREVCLPCRLIVRGSTDVHAVNPADARSGSHA